MREYMLRGFDRNDGKVKEVERIDFANELVLFKGENGWVDGDNYELMHCTGLKDKNDVKIYEGDICIVSLSYFKIKDEKAIVIFHNGAFQFQYGCEKFFSKPHDAWDNVEVIGNIYENPELLS